jgi:transposase
MAMPIVCISPVVGRKGLVVKSPGEFMEILAAYDMTRSYRDAAKICGVSHNTVRSYVKARQEGAQAPVARQRGSELQRLEKLLEDAGIKLSSVATDLTGVSPRAMLASLIEGERDPVVLADLAVYSLRAKIPALTEALNGRFNAHHAFLARLHLNIIDGHTRAIEELSGRIEAVLAPFRLARDLLVSIPGVSQRVAEIIIAETGADMSVFPTAAHLPFWPGTAPGEQ